MRFGLLGGASIFIALLKALLLGGIKSEPFSILLSSANDAEDKPVKTSAAEHLYHIRGVRSCI
jgi:hypothetical protein